jgi:hypothetical protein
MYKVMLKHGCMPASKRYGSDRINMIVGALDSTMPVRSAPGVAVTHGVVLAGTTFVELEVKAEGLPLAVDQVADLGTRAEGGLSVTKRILMALLHVRMGLAEADDTERSTSGWCNWGERNGSEPKPSFCMGGSVKEVNASHLLGWHHVTAGALLRKV